MANTFGLTLTGVATGVFGHPEGFPEGILLRTAGENIAVQNIWQRTEEILKCLDSAGIPYEGVRVEGSDTKITNAEGHAIGTVYTDFRVYILIKQISINGEIFFLAITLANNYIGQGSFHIGVQQKHYNEAVYVEVIRQVCSNGLKMKVREAVKEEVVHRETTIKSKIRNTGAANKNFEDFLTQLEFLLASEALVRSHIERLMVREVPVSKEDLLKILMNQAGLTYTRKNTGAETRTLDSNFSHVLDTYNREYHELGYTHGQKNSNLWLGLNAVNGFYASPDPQAKFKVAQVEVADKRLFDFAFDAVRPFTNKNNELQDGYNQNKWVSLRTEANKGLVS
jgi:hypothetical protein